MASGTSRSDLRRAVVLLLGCVPLAAGCTLGGGHAWPPGRRPYDRLVAWAQAGHAIPAAWTEQVRPDGIIVTPLRRRTPQVVRTRVLSA
jgi:protein-L-isoaspartate O-methyltransferase